MKIHETPMTTNKTNMKTKSQCSKGTTWDKEPKRQSRKIFNEDSIALNSKTAATMGSELALTPAKNRIRRNTKVVL